MTRKAAASGMASQPPPPPTTMKATPAPKMLPAASRCLLSALRPTGRPYTMTYESTYSWHGNRPLRLSRLARVDDMAETWPL